MSRCFPRQNRQTKMRSVRMSQLARLRPGQAFTAEHAQAVRFLIQDLRWLRKVVRALELPQEEDVHEIPVSERLLWGYGE